MKKLHMLFIGCLSTTSIYSMDIFEAVRTGNIARIKELIAADPGVVNRPDDDGETPSHKTVIEGHQAALQILIDNGADVDRQDTLGRTPLHLASQRGYQNIVQTLVNAHAAVNAQDRFTGNTPLHYAVIWNKPNNAKILLNAHAETHAKGKKGRTPLKTAEGGSEWTEERKPIAQLIKNHMLREEILTTLEALHPRLGANSPMKDIPQWIFRDNIFEWLKKINR